MSELKSKCCGADVARCFHADHGSKPAYTCIECLKHDCELQPPDTQVHPTKEPLVEVKDLEKVAEKYEGRWATDNEQDALALRSIFLEALTESTAPLLLEIKELKATIQMQSSALSVTEQDKEKQELLDRIHKQESQIAVKDEALKEIKIEFASILSAKYDGQNFQIHFRELFKRISVLQIILENNTTDGSELGERKE